MLFLFKEMTERCQKRSCPSSPNSNGRWGTVHLLNRQPAHLATGNLKQILGSPSQFFFCKSYPWENLAKEHSILVRIFGLQHHFVFIFLGHPVLLFITRITQNRGCAHITWSPYVVQGDPKRLWIVIFFWRTQKCNNPMIFREHIQRFSNIKQLLHHMRPEHSDAPSEGPKP